MSIRALAIAVAIVACAPAGSGAAAAPRAALPTAVPYRAEQVILPPEQFPIAGYVVRQDQATSGGWQRIFGLPGRDDGAIGISVLIIPPEVSDTASFFTELAKRSCTLTGSATSARDTGASNSPVGDVDRFCVFGYATGPATLEQMSLLGHYYVAIVAVGSPSVTTSDQLSRTVDVMKVQIGIIRKLAP